MSGFTQTTNELLYAYYGAGTVSTPTTTPGSSMTLGYPEVIVPGGYMSNNGLHSSSLKLVGGGLFIATATVPTFQFSLWSTTAQPAAFSASTGLVVGQTGIMTAPAATTGCPFEMEWNIGLRTLGLGAASTVVCWGHVRLLYAGAGTVESTNYTLSVPAPGATYAPSDTSWPTDQQVYLWPTVSLGAATAGNTVTMEWMKLYGEN
jgi:hypothetical protein